MKYIEAVEIKKRIIREWIAETDAIIAKAEADGVYLGGLDGNKELFKDIDDEYKQKLRDLWQQIDEEERRKYEEKEE